MARIRTIKPSFFRSIPISELPVSTRMTFIGLWTYVDDEGRGVDDVRLIKSELWPLDKKYTFSKVENDLSLLHAKGLIIRYTVGTRGYLAISSWREHQKINRPYASSLPAPAEGSERSLNEHGTITERSLQERKGKERKGVAATAAPKDEKEERLADLAHELTVLAMEQRTKPAGTNGFVKALGIIKAILKAGHTPEQVRATIKHGVDVWSIGGFEVAIKKTPPLPTLSDHQTNGSVTGAGTLIYHDDGSYWIACCSNPDCELCKGTGERLYEKAPDVAPLAIKLPGEV